MSRGINFAFLALALCALSVHSVVAGIPTVASVDPFLGTPILYDSGSPLAPFVPSASLDPNSNGGLTISGIEVLAPFSVYTTTDDGFVGADTTIMQLNSSAGPGTNGTVGLPAALSVNSRGYDLTLNPVSGLLGVAATPPSAAGGPGTGVPGVYELDPAGVAPPALYSTLSAKPTTSGLTYSPGAVSAEVSTDGISGAITGPPLAGGIYSTTPPGPETLIALDSLPAPAGVGFPGGGPAPGDDHVVTLDGRTIFLNDGTNLLHDVTGGAGATSLLIDLTTVPGLPPFLFGGGVRGDVDPFSGNIFIGWGLFGPNIIRVDEFGGGASPAVIGFDSVRDIAFGPSSLAPAGPAASGISMYVTELDTTAGGHNNIWEIPVLIPEPATASLLLCGGLALAFVRSRRRR